MAEYIERDAFLEHMKRTDRYFDVKYDVENFPASDVAPVVYCRECKYHHWEQEPCHGRTEHYCSLIDGLTTVSRDTFCSYGKRREMDGGEDDGNGR